VTLGGLFGHAVALRVWRHNKPIGAITMAISAFGLVISLSNSLGAMAGRGNEQQAARMRVADTVRDLRRGLESAESERKGLKFEPADEAAVTVARTKAAAATKEAECKYIRGQRCRDKEAEESSALAALDAAARNKAAADRALKLDADIAAFREKIEKAGPVLEANSQGNALARLFNLPEAKAATLTTYQNLAMALVIELLIVISLVAGEVLEHHETKTPALEARPIAPTLAPTDQTTQAAPSEKQAQPLMNAGKDAPLLEPLPHDVGSKVFPVLTKPRLIASTDGPQGNVAAIMAEIMEPGRGKVEFAEAYTAYVKLCRQRNKRPVSPEDYSSALRELCDACGIKLQSSDDHVYLLRVKISFRRKNCQRRKPECRVQRGSGCSPLPSFTTFEPTRMTPSGTSFSRCSAPHRRRD
jgi:hypothetical protein